LDAAQDAAKAQRSQLDAAQLQRSALETGLAAAQKSLQTAQDQYTLLLNKQAEPSAQNLASQRKVQAEQARVQAEQAQLSAEQSEVSVRQAENQVRQAEIQVEQATLRIQQITKQIEDFKHQQFAEATGTVLSLAVQGGDVASVGRVLMEIGETSNRNLKITANIPEYDIAAVELDQAVEITGNALGKSVCRGVVSKLAPVAEQRQVGNSMETVVVVEIAPNPEDPVALRPGYSVETTIVTDIAPNTVVVPIMAVVSEPNGDNYVYVIRDKYNLEKRPILTGRYSNIYVEAIGVAEGERVVVSPPEGLTEDSHVRTNLEA
jgi:HlyD family secretion protein